MTKPGFEFTTPRNAFLRWLADPGPNVPEHVRQVLLVELFSSASAVVAGIADVLMVNVLALWLDRDRSISLLLAANIAISAIRLSVVGRLIAAKRQNRAAPIEFFLVSGLLWCGMLGALSFACLQSNVRTLQILATCTTMAVMGPICARNYPAPRYAMLLCCLCDLPFVAGCVASGNLWLTIIIAMTPFYLLGSHATMTRFQQLAVETLLARHESQVQARQDPLTGLLNRTGLMEALLVGPGEALPPLTLFHLDLDGFKQVNDRFGHQAGDRLLAEAAGRIKNGVRAGDIAARTGGDEFVVIAPEMQPLEAEAFAARLIRLVQAPYHLPGIGAPCIGVSIGFACAPEDSSTLNELYRLADVALYAVKAESKGSQRRATAQAA